jgi:hypothetical protein
MSDCLFSNHKAELPFTNITLGVLRDGETIVVTDVNGARVCNYTPTENFIIYAAFISE